MRQHLSVGAAVISPVLFVGTVGLAALVGGCQTTSPTPDAKEEQVASSEAERSGAQATDQPIAGEQTPEERTRVEGQPPEQNEAEAQGLPDSVSLIIEITADRLIVAEQDILTLDQGYVPESGFSSRRYFKIKGLVETVDEALVVERRRRVIAGEDVDKMRALVKIAPDVPSDTLLGLQYTLASTDLEWMTLQIGEHEPVHVRLNDDFVGQRVIRFEDRRPASSSESDEEAQSNEGDEQTALLGVLGSVDSTSSGIEQGIAGVGRGGGGLGVRRSATNADDDAQQRDIRPARHCDTSAEVPAEKLALTHAAVRLDLGRMSMWLSPRHRRYPVFLSDEITVEHASPPSVDDYPWWKLYNAFAEMSSHYGEAQTLLIWPHPSLSAEFVRSVSRVNCKLPKRSYASKEAWEEARDQLDEQSKGKACEPMFRTQLLANGEYPRDE